MKLSKRDPNIELVILQLTQLIAAYKRAADEQIREYREEGERIGKITLSIIALRPRDLLPDARNIITYKIAKWLDSAFECAESIVNSQLIQSLEPQDLDFYLELITLTMNSWLGNVNKVKTRVMIIGSDYHLKRGESYANNRQWSLAEAEYLKALKYDEENFPFSGGLVISLTNIGLTLHFQERDYEANEYFERSIASFAKLQHSAMLYDEAKDAYELAKSMLPR